MIGQRQPAGEWGQLSLFLSRDVLETRYKARHGGKLSASKAREIISHLSQGREYFATAQDAAPLVKPLLQYYGVLAFARALVLYRDPQRREASLKPSHGLSATLDGGANLEEMRISVAVDGAFRELLDATKNSELITINESDHLESASFLPSDRLILQRFLQPTGGSTFSLQELLARIPDLRALFEEALGKRASCYSAFISGPSWATHISIRVNASKLGLPSTEELRSALGLQATDHVVLYENKAEILIEVGKATGTNIYAGLPPIHGHGQFSQSVIELFPGGWALSELGTRGGPGFSDTGISGSPSGLDRRGDHAKTET